MLNLNKFFISKKIDLIQISKQPPQTLYPPMYKVPPPAVPAPQQPAHLVTQTSTAPAVPQQQVVAQQPSSSVQATAPSTSSRPSTSNYNPRFYQLYFSLVSLKRKSLTRIY